MKVPLGTENNIMEKSSRLWMGLAAIMLISVYIFPIWSIQLNAPQYPEGIGLNIKVNNIEGKKPNDLQNINGLNHYIGMKKISPESIPELSIMPYLFGFLIVAGLAVAVWGSPKWVLSWLIVFVLLAIAGLVDFYIWEYNYGHDLNPDAPIKVPGMNYQPPLIGSKQLLNIKAVSLPHIGFFGALISMGIGGFVYWRERAREHVAD